MATEPQPHASLEIGFAMFGKVFTSLLNIMQSQSIFNLGNASIQQHTKWHRPILSLIPAILTSHLPTATHFGAPDLVGA